MYINIDIVGYIGRAGTKDLREERDAKGTRGLVSIPTAQWWHIQNKVPNHIASLGSNLMESNLGYTLKGNKLRPANTAEFIHRNKQCTKVHVMTTMCNINI